MGICLHGYTSHILGGTLEIVFCWCGEVCILSKGDGVTWIGGRASQARDVEVFAVAMFIPNGDGSVQCTQQGLFHHGRRLIHGDFIPHPRTEDRPRFGSPDSRIRGRMTPSPWPMVPPPPLPSRAYTRWVQSWLVGCFVRWLDRWGYHDVEATSILTWLGPRGPLLTGHGAFLWVRRVTTGCSSVDCSSSGPWLPRRAYPWRVDGTPLAWCSQSIFLDHHSRSGGR